MKSLWITALATTLAIGCGIDERPDGNNGGPDGGNGSDGGGGGGGGGDDGGGGGGDNCSDESKLIYVVDSNYVLLNFDPSTKTFTTIGNLSCPNPGLDEQGSPATPFSMGVDRTPSAWVLYNSGKLFKVNVETAACQPTSWTGPSNLKAFGMGFSSDVAGGTTETLYVTGGGSFTDVLTETSTFASINTTSLTSTQLGSVRGSPELTGTGSAELWGFFPTEATPRVEKINKLTGAPLQTFNVPTLRGTPRAWAFAFWGGDFWVFLMKGSEANTSVYQISGTDGSIKSTTNAPGRTIVGAGVSTCAPIVIL
jgi:hypothetical protein